MEVSMRIIAGVARGRKLETPQGMDTRPTLDRVKEALFGSIQFDLPGSVVLDLFSGSGALGLEAVSRGANIAWLNDYNADCVRCIRQNAATTGLSEQIRILQQDYRSAIDTLSAQGIRFDLVFLDAPYADGTAQDAAERLFRADMITDRGYIVLEHAVDLPPQEVSGLMRIRKTKKYGTCAFSILERDDPPAD